MTESVKQIDNDGTRSWRINGQLHRTDGPAVEWPNGSREWWPGEGVESNVVEFLNFVICKHK